ncbi:PREDICTED: T-cell activation Rho GTPase-activating protein [Propithecus coquereli]|uniref:T-cell activation Rho GTPase-activating protein n=1 Tax=Propithecus coquereli TaxID=379532 RepID=UPI00063F89EF|nr:PREDICTED: T-cell activation Rho GTPase-activating protein [Propithecus coquereli]
MKLISNRNASKTLNAGDMETLIECQSEGDIKEHPLLASCESEDSICQFIEVKKRKKVLSWPFLLRRLSPSSDFSGALEPELKASLFDQPLSIICGENDTLPRPIQDILTILCLKGPSTEGIFRKAANEKARKELKEELNCGGAVDLERRPVHLLAVVFKDFLRSIPMKLLSSDLFEEWMGALEMQDEEERIEALKQVADKLPRPNLLLLKHLVYVLYLISKNSEVSKMDSSNLAICIGPNMLTLENDQNLSFEAQKDLNNKVKTLVEFLIDNCFEIFGENIPVHSSITSDDSLEHTDSSDTSTLQNDSAYDSNDPDVESNSNSTINSPGGQPLGPTGLAASLDDRGPRDACESRPEPIASTVARLKGRLSQPDRRHSEPSMLSSQECLENQTTNRSLTKSEDDLPTPREGCRLESEDAEDPFPEEVFSAGQGKTKRPVDLKIKNLTQGLALPRGLVPKALSSGSLDGCSDSSPVASPSSPKRNFFTRHQSFSTKTEKSKPNREIKKHSMSFSFASHKKVLTKTPSSGKPQVFTRDQVTKGSKKESQLAGRIVQEDGSETHSPAALGCSSRSCALWVDDVFQLAEPGGPGSPPSYDEAIRCQAWEPAAYGSQTVGSMRARLLSQDPILPPLLPSPHGEDSRDRRSGEPLAGHRLSPLTQRWAQSRTVSASVETLGHLAVPGRPELHRLRTASETVQKNKRDYLMRRCSQPIFEADQLQYAKESYI